MSFGAAPFGLTPFGHVELNPEYGDVWLRQCVPAAVWTPIMPQAGLLSDPCDVVLIPPIDQEPPDIPRRGATWAGIRLPSVPIGNQIGDGSLPALDGDVQFVGDHYEMTWNAISQGDVFYTVQEATLKLTAAEDNEGFAQILVHGDLQPKPPPYGASETIKARPLTQAQLVWEPPGLSEGDEITIDVKDIVQELVDQPLREIGDPLAFVLIGVVGRRVFEADTSPVLTVRGK